MDHGAELRMPIHDSEDEDEDEDEYFSFGYDSDSSPSDLLPGPDADYDGDPAFYLTSAETESRRSPTSPPINSSSESTWKRLKKSFIRSRSRRRSRSRGRSSDSSKSRESCASRGGSSIHSISSYLSPKSDCFESGASPVPPSPLHDLSSCQKSKKSKLFPFPGDSKEKKRGRTRGLIAKKVVEKSEVRLPVYDPDSDLDEPGDECSGFDCDSDYESMTVIPRPHRRSSSLVDRQLHSQTISPPGLQGLGAAVPTQV
jgi:hypothetical protein